MKKYVLFLSVLIFLFFVSCGSAEQQRAKENEKEYQIQLEDVFEVLEFSEMEEFITRYGEDGYSSGDNLFPNPSFYKENIYLDKNDFSILFDDYDIYKQNTLYLNGDVCTEELMQEIVEQIEMHYSIKMEQQEKWKDGCYFLNNYYKEEEIIYYIAFTKYDLEKTIIIGIGRGDNEIVEIHYKDITE